MNNKPKKYIINLNLDDSFTLKDNLTFLQEYCEATGDIDFPLLDISYYCINFIMDHSEIADKLDNLSEVFLNESHNLVDLYEESFIYFDDKEVEVIGDEEGTNYKVNYTYDGFIDKVIHFFEKHYDSFCRVAGIIQSYIKYPVSIYKCKFVYGRNSKVTAPMRLVLFLVEENRELDEVNKPYCWNQFKLDPKTIEQIEEIKHRKDTSLFGSFDNEKFTEELKKLKEIIGQINFNNSIKPNDILIRANKKTHQIPINTNLGFLKELMESCSIKFNEGNLSNVLKEIRAEQRPKLREELIKNLNLNSLKFNTPRDRIIFGLTKLTGEERLKFLGVYPDNIGDNEKSRKKRNRWLSYMLNTLDRRDSKESEEAFNNIWFIHNALVEGIWPVKITTF